MSLSIVLALWKVSIQPLTHGTMDQMNCAVTLERLWPRLQLSDRRYFFNCVCVCVCAHVVNRGLKTKQYVQASTNRNYSVSMVYSRKMLIQTNVALKLICNFHHWWCFQVQAVSSSCQALIYPHNIKDASFDLSIEPLWSFWSLVWKMKCSCFPKKEF